MCVLLETLEVCCQSRGGGRRRGRRQRLRKEVGFAERKGVTRGGGGAQIWGEEVWEIERRDIMGKKNDIK